MGNASATHFVSTADGARIEVRVDDGAAAGGPAIVLLPSSQRDSYDFDALAQRLADAGHRVLRPQPRGIGLSSAAPADLTLHLLAADVARVVEQLAGRPAIVAGHAYGHYVARVADLDHPEWVKGVVVLAGAAREVAPGLVEALDTAADPVRPRAERLAALQHAFFAHGSDASVWLDGWYPQWRTLYRRAAATPGRDAWWPRSHAPLLDLQAADDPWRPPATRQDLQHALGDKLSVRVIAAASHALIPEQPAAVADAIVSWARSLPV